MAAAGDDAAGTRHERRRLGPHEGAILSIRQHIFWLCNDGEKRLLSVGCHDQVTSLLCSEPCWRTAAVKTLLCAQHAEKGQSMLIEARTRSGWRARRRASTQCTQSGSRARPSSTSCATPPSAPA